MELYRRPDVYRRRWRVLAVLSLGLALVIMSLAGVNVALASLQRELGVSLTVLQWINNAYTLTFGGLLLSAGALGDRYGRKGALAWGLVIFIGAALLGGVANDAAVLLVSRAVMGIGAAFIMPATLSITTNVFGPAERPTAIAVWAGVASAGGALGPLLTGVLLTGWWFIPPGGWELAFLYNVPLGGAVLLASVLWIPRSSDPEAARGDPLGALTSLVALSALLFWLIEGPERGWTSPLVVAALAAALAFGAAFVAWERRSAHPMLPLSLFSVPRFRVGAGVNTMSFLVLIGFWFLLILYVQFALGYSPLQAGLTTLPEALSGMLVAPFTPRLVSRYGARRVMAVGFGVLTVCFALLAATDATTPYSFLAAPITLAGVGLSLTTVPATNDIMAATPLAKAGVGSAVNDATRELGAALGIATLGTLSAVLYRRSVEGADLREDLAEAAADSPGAALEATSELADAGELSASGVETVASVVAEAFSRAFSLSMLAAAIIAALCGVWVLLARREAASRRRQTHDAAEGAQEE
ncbi:MAG: MFS transporter [Acidimicrobiia bacterium]|nr:MFS transporter [Acidimicrobiia bacterium]MYB25297.1 MFS transporter [Acidimicrobiia bacterium]MYJ13389.1 MFS transporter [Acidimicrobiia bacterium]